MRWKWIFWFGVLLGDALILYFSFWVSYEIRFFYEPFLRIFPANKGIPEWGLYQEALRTVIPLWVLILAFWGGLYRSRFSDAADDFLAVLKSVTLAVALMVAATFLYRPYEYSRLVMGLVWLISVFALFLHREFWRKMSLVFYHRIFPKGNVALLAKGKIAETVCKLLSHDPHRNLLVFADSEIGHLQEKVGAGLKLEEVVVQGQFLNDGQIEQFLDDCEERDIGIKILPDFLEMRLGEIQVDDSLGLPILRLKPLSLHGYRFWIKRSFDITLSVLIIAVLFFPLAVISILILVDSPGPIFFRQDRVGFKEKIFKCVKFRTMRKEAEQILAEMNLPSFRGGPGFKMKGDPRVTRVGRWLRKFSLDELPQIWNVLRGEMSLIGPRPQVLAEASGNPVWAKKRYRVLPGITGLWQVSGRADLAYEDMMRLDIYYLENWSPGLDLRILLKTLPVILSGKGAY